MGRELGVGIGNRAEGRRSCWGLVAPGVRTTAGGAGGTTDLIPDGAPLGVLPGLAASVERSRFTDLRPGDSFGIR